MMTQVTNLQRWILLFVFYICNNPHLVKVSIFSPMVVVLPYHCRNFWFWTMYFLLVKKALQMRKAWWMKQPIKISLQTYLENLCENFAWKCFQLNLTLNFYHFVHFNSFSCFKICKICNTLIRLKQNLLLNPPIFLTLLISRHLFQLLLISNMIIMNFSLKHYCSRIVSPVLFKCLSHEVSLM